MRHKTFPWGKGDRREAVVDEGYSSTVSPKLLTNPQLSTAGTSRTPSPTTINESDCVNRGHDKSCPYEVVHTMRAIDNRPYEL